MTKSGFATASCIASSIERSDDRRVTAFCTWLPLRDIQDLTRSIWPGQWCRAEICWDNTKKRNHTYSKDRVVENKKGKMKKHESFQGHLWYTLSDEFVCNVISLSLFKFCPACDTFTASPRRLGELKCDKHFLADLGHSWAGLCVQMCAGSAESFSYWLPVHMVAHGCTAFLLIWTKMIGIIWNLRISALCKTKTWACFISKYFEHIRNSSDGLPPPRWQKWRRR